MFANVGTRVTRAQPIFIFILYVPYLHRIVFYVGPRNSYGKKEQNPTFWLKLFLLNKQELTFSWQDTGGKLRLLHLAKDDWRILVRFLMSFLINGVGFLFLLHVLPVQVAGQSTIIGVLFRSVGMIYLVDLDDITGNTMTLVSSSSTSADAGNGESSAENYGSTTTGLQQQQAQQSALSTEEFEAEKQRIIQDAMKDVETKLQALARGERPMQPRRGMMSSITGALFMFSNNSNPGSEEAPLV